MAIVAVSTLKAQDAPISGTPNGWTAGGIRFRGLADGYYSLNFNHPSNHTNVSRNFDVDANQFSLNLAKVSLERTPAPIGFQIEFAAGAAMDLFHANSSGGSLNRHILQAYASAKPAAWKGVQVDVGKFVTSAGAEVTETHLNWNYSRSLLYANGPYYHMGLRTTVPLGRHWTGGFQLVNGWNNVKDNNRAKTAGLTAAFVTSRFNWFHTYYAGNEHNDREVGVKVRAPGLRHFYDTVVTLNPQGATSALLNFDYGVDKSPTAGDKVFHGTSAALRHIFNQHFALSPRWDWYKDRNGFITGNSRTLQDITLTFDYKVTEGLLMRYEYRRDWSGSPYFDRGHRTGNARIQTTALVGMVVYFGPSR